MTRTFIMLSTGMEEVQQQSSPSAECNTVRVRFLRDGCIMRVPAIAIIELD